MKLNTMKWNKMIAVLVGVQLFCSVPVNAAEAQTKVKINNQVVALQHNPIVVNGRTLVDAAELAKMLKGKVIGNNLTCSLTVGSTHLTFKPNTNLILGEDKWLPIEQGAVVRSQTTYLPLRWVAEKLGHQIKWDAEARMVQIIVEEGPDAFLPLDYNSFTDEEKAFIASSRKEKGIHQKGNLYVVARGESPNPGYGIEYVRQEVSWERLFVYVRLTKPEPGKMYPQVISYPFLAGRVHLNGYTTVTFIDADTGKPLFQ